MNCPFCGLDPYEYVDIGIGQQAVGVSCCDLGWYYFDGGEKYNHCGMPYKEVIKIKEEMECVENDVPEDDFNNFESKVEPIPF